MSKMTPWFPPEIKPVHVGEYNASVANSPDSIRYWNGSYWSAGYGYYSDEYSKDRAKNHRALNPIFWRGLASKPKGWKP